MEPDVNELLKNQNRDFAVGNDVVFIPDFKRMFNQLFRNKAYTKDEIAYCEQFEDPILRYASTWAAKEAVYKAVKQLDRTAMGFKAIEIMRAKPAGVPDVKLHKHPGRYNISLSITHDGDYVWAVCLIA